MDDLYRFVECVDDDCEKDELHESVLVKPCEHGKLDKHDYQGKIEGGWCTMICEGAFDG